jgi:hypothetical protein
MDSKKEESSSDQSDPQKSSDDGKIEPHSPRSPEERLAALQDALKVDPGPKSWGWAAIQVSFHTFPLPVSLIQY